MESNITTLNNKAHMQNFYNKLYTGNELGILN